MIARGEEPDEDQLGIALKRIGDALMPRLLAGEQEQLVGDEEGWSVR